MLPFTPFTAPEHQDFFLTGGKPAALLVHGYPGTPFEMRPIAEVLNEHGWSCRGILLPGFGIGLETLPNRIWTEWRDAVSEALSALKKEHAPVILVGHSMGAAVGLTAVTRLPVDGLILLAPYWRARGLGWAILPFIKHLLKRVKPFKLIKTELDDPHLRRMIKDFLPEINLEDPEVQEAVRELVVPLKMFDELRKVGLAGFRSAPHVTCPSLIIQGSKDSAVHPRDTHRLTERLSGKVTMLQVAASHELPFAASPTFPEVRDAVLDFTDWLLASYN